MFLLVPCGGDDFMSKSNSFGGAGAGYPKCSMSAKECKETSWTCAFVALILAVIGLVGAIAFLPVTVTCLCLYSSTAGSAAVAGLFGVGGLLSAVATMQLCGCNEWTVTCEGWGVWYANQAETASTVAILGNLVAAFNAFKMGKR